MSRCLNRVALIGYVGADPEVRSTSGGTRVANLSLGTTSQWKDGDGAKQEKTEWHRIQAWQGLAGVIEEYVVKGDRLYISGRLEYRKWTDKDGQERYSTEIVAEEMIMLSSADSKPTRNAPAAKRDNNNRSRRR